MKKFFVQKIVVISMCSACLSLMYCEKKADTEGNTENQGRVNGGESEEDPGGSAGTTAGSNETSDEDVTIPGGAEPSPKPGLKNPFNRKASGLQTDYEVTHGGQVRKFHFFCSFGGK